MSDIVWCSKMFHENLQIFYTTFQWQESVWPWDPATDQTPILTVQCHEEKEKTTNIVAYTDTV